MTNLKIGDFLADKHGDWVVTNVDDNGFRIKNHRGEKEVGMCDLKFYTKMCDGKHDSVQGIIECKDCENLLRPVNKAQKNLRELMEKLLQKGFSSESKEFEFLAKCSEAWAPYDDMQYSYPAWQLRALEAEYGMTVSDINKNI